MRSLLVDGYNVIYAWPALRKVMLGEGGAEEARRQLIVALAEYQAVRQVSVTAVFDGPRNVDREIEEVIDGVKVRFSGGTSADHVIERLAYAAARSGGAANVTVATSDRLQGDLVRAMGVSTVGARQLEEEVRAAIEESASRAKRSRDVARFSRRLEHHISPETLARLEALRRGGTPSGDDEAP